MTEAILEDIVSMSHEFGTESYVRGGGGNTSCKNATTLWVKPSGTTLIAIEAQQFVAMDRPKIADLYEVSPPDNWVEREEMVKNMAQAAVLPESSGRPSVEAPLHDTFPHTFVVHTHPALVNGMTCARDGEAVCKKLFPEALWIPFTDPGYTLCIRVRDEMKKYEEKHGRAPDSVFLQSHGVFFAADTVEGIRQLYANAMQKLQSLYDEAGINTEMTSSPAPSGEDLSHAESEVKSAFAETVFTAASGPFAVMAGPISPDHIVYAKSYPLTGEITSASVAAYEKERGYPPRVVVTDKAVFGVGANQNAADLALEFAMDGALVQKLADAFGGIVYLDKRATDFIENWEVESYRSKVAES